MKSYRLGKKPLQLAALLGLSVSSLAIEAQAAAITIEPQPLASALREFSEQSGLQVGFETSLVQGLSAGGVTAEGDLKTALETLLSRSGLKYQFINETTVVIQASERMDNGAVAEAEADTQDNTFVLEEIIVTATRREASLMDIPMAVTAYGGERLKESGINDLRDIQFIAPGVHVLNDTGTTQIAIRGVGNNSFIEGAESAAAVHIDGVYLAQQTEIGGAFLDIERIEVLRGPQGTLYGRNATAGAVNIITKSPSAEFEAGGTVTFGNYALVETEGYVSGPVVGEKLTARVAFKTRDHNGYTPNLYDGVALDNSDFAAVRGKISYAVTDRFDLDAAVDFVRDHGVPTYIYTRGISGAPLVGEIMGSVLPTGRRVNYNNDNINEKETWGGSLKASWDLGTMVLNTLSAYRKHSFFHAIEFDGTDQSIFYIDELQRQAKQISQEITLTSAGESRLDWVVGAYYFYNKQSSFGSIPLPSLGITIDYGTPVLKGNAYAAFGEANYAITDKLTATFGARYSYEDKTIVESSGGVDSAPENDNWASFTPKAALTYAITDDVTGYVTIGRGFKSGGFNGVDQPAFGEERVTNYEAGLKTSLYEGRFRFNISAFYMDYSDLQVLVQTTNPITLIPETILQNAASSTIKGVEFDGEAYPTDKIKLDWALSYLDAKFEDWPGADDVLRGAAFNAGGFRMLNAPEWAASVGLNYQTDVGAWGQAKLRGEYAYRSRVFFNPFENNFLSQPGFGLLNASLTFEDAEENWRFSVWGKNLTDKEALIGKFQSASALTGAPAGSYYIPPRTYGVSVSYTF